MRYRCTTSSGASAPLMAQRLPMGPKAPAPPPLCSGGVPPTAARQRPQAAARPRAAAPPAWTSIPGDMRFLLPQGGR